MASETRTLPAGFHLKAVNTSASGVDYTVEVPQADSLQAILDAYRELEPDKNPEEIVVALWNASNEQGAKQGQKQLVREAVDEHGKDAPEVQAAISKHQESAAGFIQGAPRGGGGGGARHESGLTKKQREALGTAVALEMVRNGGKPPAQARMREIAAELGIDPEALAA